METEVIKEHLKTPLNEGSPGPHSKTSLRMIYEAQVSVIKKQLGDLEKIRTDLGLSQRKMAQLLMVDPSAWTRWNRPEEEAPPHIWRALQWYMSLQEKIPGLTPQYFIGKDPQILQEKMTSQIEELKKELFKQESKLQKELRFHRGLSYFMGFLCLLMGLGFFLR